MSNFLEPIIGQDSAVSLLNKIYLNKRIPHAFMFNGTEGVGKFFSAIQFIKLINSDSANTTNIEKNISRLKEPYVKFISQLPRGKGEGNDDGPLDKISKSNLENIIEEYNHKADNPYYQLNIQDANTIKISSIREIRKFISLEYSDLKYRAIIIQDAHKMNDQSQNALLKSLEEPPEGIIFFLLTPYPDQLLTTIQSRCWIINFSPLDNQSLKKILMEYFEIDKILAEKVSYFAGGSVTEAIKLIDNDFEFLLEKTISLLRFSLSRKYNQAYKELSSLISKSNKANFEILLGLILQWLSDVNKDRFKNSSFHFNEYADTIIKYNQKYPNSLIEQLYAKIEELKSSISKNISLNLIGLNVIFEIGYLGTR